MEQQDEWKAKISAAKKTTEDALKEIKGKMIICYMHPVTLTL